MIQKIKRFIIDNNLFVFLALLLVVGAIFSPDSFYNYRNLASILRISALVGIATLGQSMVLLIKAVDLSVGAVMGLASVFIAVLIEPLGLANSVMLLIVLCALIGLTNGLLVVKGGIPPIIATLGMMWLLRGISGSITDGRLVRIIETSFTNIASSTIFKIFPYFFLGLLIVYFVIYFFFSEHKVGSYIYAVGGNEEAAYYSGININKIKITVFVVASILFGIAGLLMTSYIQVGMPYMAEGYEFRSITSAALGGIALSGGEGNILKALLGAIILTVLYSLLTNLGVSPYLQGIFEGIILVGAVYLCQKK